MPQDVQTTLHPSNDRVSLLHVCRYLREVVFATHSLWATVKVPLFNFRDTQKVSTFKEIFATIVQSSFPLPLTFSINIVDSPDSVNQDLALYCLELLCKQSSRWRAVFVDTSALSVLSDYIEPGSLDQLEHIGVIGCSPPFFYSQPCWTLLSSAPRLTSAECHDFGSHSEKILHPLLLNLPHVSHFSASGSIEPYNKIGVYLGVLRFSTLTSLDLWFPGLDSHDLFGLPPSVKPEPLPLLLSLSVKFGTWEWIASFSSAFSFPNITSLTVATDYPCNYAEVDPILALYTACSPTLGHIGLSSYLIQHKALDSLLRTITTLRSMTIFDIHWNAPFFEWLETLVVQSRRETESTDIVLRYPNLQRLTLHSEQRDGFVECRWDWLREENPLLEPLVMDGRFGPRFMFKSGMQLLQEMVASRWNQPTSDMYHAVSHLEYFTVDYDCLYAMHEYAPECYAFLIARWNCGMEGRPFPPLRPHPGVRELPYAWAYRDSETRGLPDTWACREAVPRFFREGGDEDDAHPWARDSKPRLFREFDDEKSIHSVDSELDNGDEDNGVDLAGAEASDVVILSEDDSETSMRIASIQGEEDDSEVQSAMDVGWELHPSQGEIDLHTESFDSDCSGSMGALAGNGAGKERAMSDDVPDSKRQPRCVRFGVYFLLLLLTFPPFCCLVVFFLGRLY